MSRSGCKTGRQLWIDGEISSPHVIMLFQFLSRDLSLKQHGWELAGGRATFTPISHFYNGLEKVRGQELRIFADELDVLILRCDRSASVKAFCGPPTGTKSRIGSRIKIYKRCIENNEDGLAHRFLGVA